MDFEDLPEHIQIEIRLLKHGAATIEADINQVLDEAENLEDFKSTVSASIRTLAEEALGNIANFCGTKRSKKELGEIAAHWEHFA